MDEDLFFSIKTKDADTVEKILNREENLANVSQVIFKSF